MPNVPAPIAVQGYQNEKVGFWGIPGTDDEPTPELRWPLSIAVYDQMRRQDAQIRSVLRAVVLPILRTDWWIEPNGARDEVVHGKIGRASCRERVYHPV